MFFIKKHPTVFVHIYVDGRIEIVAAETVTARDRFKIAMIDGWVKAHKDVLVANLNPGQYKIEMSKKMFAKDIDFDLTEV